VSVLDVVPVGSIDSGDGTQWLIEGLWTEEAVGIVSGQPKLGLCRARHNPSYPAHRIMPRE
jgi:hypothetical protein